LWSAANELFDGDSVVDPSSGRATFSFAAHSAQKFAWARLANPHAAQTQGAGAPHPMQNLAASGRVAWQLAHCIALVVPLE
jgi:hypothetical protein